MKSSRQLAILEIIRDADVETQEDLADRLRGRGFTVTQATVSRDIKELRLLKVLSPNGAYKYATADKAENGLSDRFLRMFSESVIGISHAYNQIVVKTLSGSANMAAEAVDSLHWPEIMGTLAGDNTFLLLLNDVEEVPTVLERLNAMLR
ncbi:MAG: arginine repressor [Candidatus Limiplasma sp.]|nr:arginine repressor [Candidatus Limiplasma sp.]